MLSSALEITAPPPPSHPPDWRGGARGCSGNQSRRRLGFFWTKETDCQQCGGTGALKRSRGPSSGSESKTPRKVFAGARPPSANSPPSETSLCLAVLRGNAKLKGPDLHSLSACKRSPQRHENGQMRFWHTRDQWLEKQCAGTSYAMQGGKGVCFGCDGGPAIFSMPSNMPEGSLSNKPRANFRSSFPS